MNRALAIGFLAASQLLHVTALAADAPGLPRPDWVARSWQTDDGLPQNTVNAILQTRDGFLWIGTSGGLARFDGVRFRTFGLQDGLRSVRIATLSEDCDGGLWIGMTGGGVSRWKDGQMTTYGTKEGFPAGADLISSVADRDGSVWFGTTEGLVKWHDGTFFSMSEEQGLPREQIRALTQDSNGTLWVSVIPGGVYRGVNDRFTQESGPNPVPKDLYSLVADHDGTIWGGAGNGILWRRSNNVWKRFDTNDGLPLASFTSLGIDAEGTLWICAEKRGLYRARKGHFEAVTYDNELSDTFVNAVAPDCENSVWVGTRQGGVNRLSKRVLNYWGSKAGLGQDPALSIAEDASGALWIGAASTGIYRFADQRFSELQDEGVSRSTHHIYTTTNAEDGSIWGAGEGCLYHFQAGVPTNAFLEAPVRGEAIRALCVVGKTVWLGTYYSTLLKCDGDKVEIVAPRRSFGGDITSIVAGEKDAIWVGSSGGLHCWQDNRIVRTWDTKDGLLTANVLALLRDPDGTIWIGTRGGGLARLKDGQITNITSRQGLIDDVISQIIADESGDLWLGCNRGLMRVQRDEIEALAQGKLSGIHPLCFGKNEGMAKEQCSGGHSPTACKTHDGRLLFPTVNGFAEIDPRLVRDVKTPSPHAVVDDAQLDGRIHPLDKTLVIPPGQHRLALNFTAPILNGGAWVQFRYRLEGVDNEWVSENRSRTATYDGLRPGSYTFLVAASGNGEKWKDAGTRLAVIVQPFYFQRFWFRAGGIALLAIAAGGVAWWSAQKRHRRQLAEIERTRVQQAELAHVSRISLLGELSASLAHELNQPLAAILGNAQAALRFLDNEPAELGDVRDCLKDIADSDRRASEIIRRMRSMMKKGEAQLEPRDINANIEEVLTLLHSDLVARQVEVTTDLQLDLPLIRGDHVQLQQVLLNLIVNGCDAMQAAGSNLRQIVVSTERDGTNFVRVSVADSGPGIPTDKLETIFDPFFSTKLNGLGMGLSICRAIIKAHGGKLWAVNNSSGLGASLQFNLRVDEER